MSEPADGPVPVAELSTVVQDYLKVIWNAQEWGETAVTTSSLATALDVTASTVSEAIRRLAERGFVRHKPYGAITLTDSGAALATAMVRRHRLLETLLYRELGYRWDEVHDEAEILEHAVSERFIDRVDRKLGAPRRDPHGDPIPSASGLVSRPDAVPLVELPTGACGVIVRIADSDPEMLRYFSEVGIGPDRSVRVMQRRAYVGTTSLSVGGGDAIDVGDRAAAAIFVADGTVTDPP